MKYVFKILFMDYRETNKQKNGYGVYTINVSQVASTFNLSSNHIR